VGYPVNAIGGKMLVGFYKELDLAEAALARLKIEEAS